VGGGALCGRETVGRQGKVEFVDGVIQRQVRVSIPAGALEGAEDLSLPGFSVSTSTPAPNSLRSRSTSMGPLMAKPSVAMKVQTLVWFVERQLSHVVAHTRYGEGANARPPHGQHSGSRRIDYGIENS
jgi:hypothetical protein